jgi:hypothetical protein
MLTGWGHGHDPKPLFLDLSTLNTLERGDPCITRHPPIQKHVILIFDKQGFPNDHQRFNPFMMTHPQCFILNWKLISSNPLRYMTTLPYVPLIKVTFIVIDLHLIPFPPLLWHISFHVSMFPLYY